MNIVVVWHLHTHKHPHTQWHLHKPVHLDIDECAINNGGCDRQRTCTNTVGSWSCGDCPTGYDDDGAKGCKRLCVCVCVRARARVSV